MIKIFLTKYKIIPFLLILIWLLIKRYENMYHPGVDIEAYTMALDSILKGESPYNYSVTTFGNIQNQYNHGFSYFPAILYIYLPFYLLYLHFGWSIHLLFKIPIFITDLAIGYLIYRETINKNYFISLTAVFFWLINPYTLIKPGYSFIDPAAILFLLLAVLYIQKDEKRSGIFYGLAVGIKTFPFVALIPLLLIAKNKKVFLGYSLITGFILSLPFILSIQDVQTYIQGTLLVHSERSLQGRPFLFYLSYLIDFEFIQTIPFYIYTNLASFSGWAISIILYFYYKVKDKFILTTLPLLSFYLFTPVLNRTYLLWAMPLFIFMAIRISEKKNKYLYYVLISLYYLFYLWYLAEWDKGFHEVIPF